MKTLILISILQLCYLALGEINLQNIEIPDIDDFQAIKEKCNKLGGNGTYTKLKEAKNQIQTCLQGFVDFKVLKNEIEEAKKTGSMDEVFGKYCNKRPKVTSCVQSFTNALRPCLNDEEKKALNITLDIFKQLGEFLCYRDGDRIAMFIAEGGVECIKDHSEGIQNCVNSTFNITPAVNTNPLPTLLLDKKKCDDLTKLQNCIVEELEKCEESTPANVIDALFRFIKRSACTNKTKRSIRSLVRRSITQANSLYNADELKSRLLADVKEKCDQNAPNGGYEAFSTSLESTFKCVKEKAKTNVMFRTPRNDYKQKFRDCFGNITTTAAACLPDEEKYFPTFYVDSVFSVVDWAYDNQNAFSLRATTSEATNCFQNFKQETAHNELTQCLKSSNSTASPKSLEKKVICTRLQEIKTCITGQIKKWCIADINIYRFADGLFGAMLTQCNKD